MFYHLSHQYIPVPYLLGHAAYSRMFGNLLHIKPQLNQFKQTSTDYEIQKKMFLFTNKKNKNILYCTAPTDTNEHIWTNI